MKVSKTSRMFQSIADTNVQNLKKIASGSLINNEKESIEEKYKNLVNQVMLNEYGFNYKTEMEFDEVLQGNYCELIKLAQSYADKEFKIVKGILQTSSQIA